MSEEEDWEDEEDEECDDEEEQNWLCQLLISFFCQQSFSLIPHESRVGDFSHVQLIRATNEHDIATFVFTIIFAFAF